MCKIITSVLLALLLFSLPTRRVPISRERIVESILGLAATLDDPLDDTTTMKHCVFMLKSWECPGSLPHHVNGTTSPNPHDLPKWNFFCEGFHSLMCVFVLFIHLRRNVWLAGAVTLGSLGSLDKTN